MCKTRKTLENDEKRDVEFSVEIVPIACGNLEGYPQEDETDYEGLLRSNVINRLSTAIPLPIVD